MADVSGDAYQATWRNRKASFKRECVSQSHPTTASNLHHPKPSAASHDQASERAGVWPSQPPTRPRQNRSRPDCSASKRRWDAARPPPKEFVCAAHRPPCFVLRIRSSEERLSRSLGSVFKGRSLPRGLEKVRASRHDDRNLLPAVLPIDAEMRIQGEDGSLGVQLRQADEARIGELDRGTIFQFRAAAHPSSPVFTTRGIP